MASYLGVDSDLVPDIRFDANLRLLVKIVCVHQNEDKTLDVRLEFNGDFEDSVAVYMEIKTGICTATEKAFAVRMPMNFRIGEMRKKKFFFWFNQTASIG